MLAIEGEVIREFMYDHQGKRKWAKQNEVGHLARSRTNSGNLRASRSTSDHFLEESYHQIIARATQAKTRKQS